MPTAARDKVFISYSHHDADFLSQLLIHLAPLKRAGLVSEWSDQQIDPGSRMLDEIKSTLAKTKVAVMLVSANYLASDFIYDHELGPLLQQVETDGVHILWILVRDCLWKETPLKNYCAAISPQRPLAEMKEERDAAWVKVCDRIKEALNHNVRTEIEKGTSSNSDEGISATAPREGCLLPRSAQSPDEVALWHATREKEELGRRDALPSTSMRSRSASPGNRGYMPAWEIRNWLGLYVLALTGGIGALFFLAPRWVLPLEPADKISSIEIILPFLLGQVAAVFRYYSNPVTELHTRLIHLPRWVVRAPPIIVTIILCIEFSLMAYGGAKQDPNLIPSPEMFRGLLTFCVALLNTSTVLVLTRYFDLSKPGDHQT